MQYWDSKGRIHNTEAKQAPLIDRISNQAKAALTNARTWLENSNPNSEDYKQKIGVALGLMTAPISGSLALANNIAKPLIPYVGKKIAQTMGAGASSGLVGGGVEGVARGALTGENPLLTGLSDSAFGAIAGLTGGLLGGNIVKGFDRANAIKTGKEAKYFNEHLQGLKKPNSKDLTDIRAYNSMGGLSNKKPVIVYDTPDDFIDLTNSFDSVPTMEEVKEFLRESAKTGKKFETSSPDYFLDVLDSSKKIDHIAKSSKFKTMNKSQKKRHNKYVLAFDDISKTLKKNGEGVENTKPDKKPNVKSYHEFNTTAKFNEKDYPLSVFAEQLVNEPDTLPQTYHLYDILENKKSPSANSLKSVNLGDDTNIITDYEKNLKSFMENADYRFLDNKGEPLHFFHGTPNAGFNEFRENSFFTPDKPYAEVYKNQGASSSGYKKNADNPDVYEVFINSKKPFDTRDEMAKNIFKNEYQAYYSPELTDRGMVDWMKVEELKPWLQENYPEYDAIIADEGGVGGYGEAVKSRGFSFVPFEPTQIKSVNNQGTFDPTNPNIYKSILAPIGAGAFANRLLNEENNNYN